jgi:hypothetical protein
VQTLPTIGSVADTKEHARLNGHRPFHSKINFANTSEAQMQSLFRNVADTLGATIVSAAVAFVISALLLLLYRLVVGYGRPYHRDVAGTTVAALTGAVAIAAIDLTQRLIDTAPGVPVSIVGRALILGSGLIVLALGLKLARTAAGYQTVRSVASDIVPFAVATAIAFFLALLITALNGIT